MPEKALGFEEVVKVLRSPVPSGAVHCLGQSNNLQGTRYKFRYKGIFLNNQTKTIQKTVNNTKVEDGVC